MYQLVNNIFTTFQAVSDDMTAIKPSDNFAVGNQQHVPDKYIISVSQVEKPLMPVKTSKASSPDNIPNWLLKLNAAHLASPVCSIFNAVLEIVSYLICGVQQMYVLCPKLPLHY